MTQVDTWQPLGDVAKRVVGKLAIAAAIRCIGIDPGIHGGLALTAGDQLIEARHIPIADNEIDAAELSRIFLAWAGDLCVIERASSRPGQGVSSTFKYGQAYGALRAVAAVCGLPVRLVTPAVWKKFFHLDADKEKARALAIRLWPTATCFTRKLDHGPAEASLIARYGVEVFGGQS